MHVIPQPAIGRPGRIHSLRVVFLCLAGCVLAAAVAATDQAYLYTIIAAMGFLLVFPMWRSWSQGRLDYFEPIHIIVFISFVYFGLGSIWTIHDPSFIAYDLHIVPYIPQAALYSLIGIASMQAGYYGPWHSRSTERRKTEWPRGALLPLGLGGLGLLGQIAWALSIRSQSAGGQLSVLLSTLTGFGPLFIVGWAMLWIVWFSGESTRSQRQVLFGVLVPGALLVLFLTASDKSLLMSLLGIPIVARWFARRSIPWTVIIILLLVLIFVVFPLYSTIRYFDASLGQTERLASAYQMVQGFDQQMYRQFTTRNFQRRLAMINSVAVVVRDVGRWVPYEMGETIFLPTVAFFVPRILWPEKPTVNLGLEFGAIFRVTDWRARTTHIAPTIPGELYWNFDLPGIVIGMALLGATMRWLYRRYCDFNGRANPMSQAIYVLLLFELVHITGGVLAPAITGITRELLLLELLRFVGLRTGLLERRP